MQAVMPNSSSTSREASLLIELVLTMLLRLALERLYISCRAEGLLGSSMPPLLLLVVGGGDLEVLPCRAFSFQGFQLSGHSPPQNRGSAESSVEGVFWAVVCCNF